MVPGALRSVSGGDTRCTVHFFSPVVASKPTTRLSIVRTTTKPWPVTGADSTSDDTCAFHISLPDMS